MPAISIELLPEFLQEDSLPGTTAVVIDVLRASTTIIHALAHGAEAVIPCLTVESATEQAALFPREARLTGGERHGVLIAGFDLGNSPLDYTPERVSGKTLIFTTTNGTRAMLQCQSADQVVIGAFVNRQAVVRFLTERKQGIHLVCAGTDGQMTAEDILFAGAVASDLLSHSPSVWNLANVQTRMAVDYYQARSHSRDLFAEAFTGSLGARNLLELGMNRDIDRCMQENLFECVPCWDARSGRITLP